MLRSDYIQVLVLLLLAGCAERSATRHYSSLIDQLPPALQQRLELPGYPPRIVVGPDAAADARMLAEDNLVLVGALELASPIIDESRLRREAKRHGADIVQVSHDFARDQGAILPLVLFEPTPVASVSLSPPPPATDLAGRTPAFLIPLEKHPPRAGAFFWRRLKPRILGVILGDVSQTGASALADGALVKLVVRHSPAEQADLRPGDIIVAVGNKPIAGYRELAALLPSLAGTRAELHVMRERKPLRLPVAFGEGG